MEDGISMPDLYSLTKTQTTWQCRRMAWQKSSGYNQRRRIETQTGCWKAVIGHKLKARSCKNQKTEANIGVLFLTRMTELGRPNFERTA
jgi:hypothetical protein